MLEAKNLSKSFGAVNALNDLNLSVQEGEILCLLGANGAGKTTTINLFLGFLEPSSGEALIDGVAAHQDPAGTKAKLGYIPEQVGEGERDRAFGIAGSGRAGTRRRPAQSGNVFQGHAPEGGHRRGTRQKSAGVVA